MDGEQCNTWASYLGKFGCLEVQCVLFIEWRTQLISYQSVFYFKALCLQRAHTEWTCLGGQGSCFVVPSVLILLTLGFSLPFSSFCCDPVDFVTKFE